MTHVFNNPKKLLIAGGALFAALALPMAASYLTGVENGFVSSAQAAESGGGGQSGSGQAQKGKPSSTGGAMGGSGSMGKKVFRAPVSAEEEDSDRPVWAGVKGGKAGGGGKPAGAGTKKGDLFGDMVVILRDENGEPILDTLDRVQVIAYIYDTAGNLVPLLNASGDPVLIPYDPVTGDLMTTITLADGSVVNVYGAEVDLGRLSVGRSPTKVLNHSLDEALAKLTADGAVVTLDATGRLVVNGVTIDSPLENLALYDVYMTTGSIPGVTLPDGFNPASLLAAAADKTGTITVDTVVYMNSILGINNLAADQYYDFSSYEYDRYTTWSSVNVTVLVLQPDGSYVPTLVNVYDTLFDADADGDGDNWVDTTAGGADDFATAADDYLQVIEFVHDNAVR